MKTIVRGVVFSCLLLFAATGVLSAQGSNAAISKGTLTLFSLNGFIEALSRQGIVATFPNGQTLGNDQISFPVDGGFLNLNTAAGEVDSRGSIVFTEGGSSVSLQRVSIENTASGAVITAGVLVNGLYFGRQPVFSIVSAQASLPFTYGEVMVANLLFEINPEFSSEVTDYFQVSPFPTGQIIGSATVDLFLVPPPR